MKRVVGYTCVACWSAALGALQLAVQAFGPAPDLASPGSVLGRALAPDLGTLFLAAAVGRLARRDYLVLALVAALGRATFTAASPLAVASGCIAVALIADVLRGFAELDRAFLRVLAAGLGALVFTLWLGFVDFVRFGDAGARGGLGFGAIDPATAAGAALTTAVTTAGVAPFVWRLFAHLPGLSLLVRRAF